MLAATKGKDLIAYSAYMYSAVVLSNDVCFTVIVSVLRYSQWELFAC